LCSGSLVTVRNFGSISILICNRLYHIKDKQEDKKEGRKEGKKLIINRGQSVKSKSGAGSIKVRAGSPYYYLERLRDAEEIFLADFRGG